MRENKPKKSSKDVCVEVTKELITAMANNDTGNWLVPWIQTGTPINVQTNKKYRGINLPILWFKSQKNDYPHNIWMTFNQVRTAGGSITKGSKGTTVIFYKMLDVKKDSKGKSLPQPWDKIPLMRWFTVFNLAQSDLEIEDVRDVKDNDAIAKAEQFIANIPHSLAEGEPSFSHETDTVSMPAMKMFETSADYYQAYLRQLAKWTAHKTRLDRSWKGATEPLLMEEMTSELAAAFVMSNIGLYENITPSASSKNMLSGYIKAMEEDARLIFRICGKAQGINDFLLKSQPEESEVRVKVVAPDKTRRDAARENAAVTAPLMESVAT